MAVKRDVFLDIADNQLRHKAADSGFALMDGREEGILVGRHRRFNRMKRTLSAFFRFTSEEVQAGNPFKPKYANCRNAPGQFTPAMVTLTYPDNSHWRPDHITAFVKHCREYAKRKWGERLRYAWVAEETKRGVVHYHVVLWLPRNSKLPKPDEQGWWPHGHSKIEAVRKGVYGYLLKYISKGVQGTGLGVHSFSESGKRQTPRMFSHGGLNPRDREFLQHQMLPAYVKDIFGGIPFGQKIRRVKGGWECGKVWVKGNWECMWSALERRPHFKFGVSWSPLPDELPDVFIPF